MAAHLVVSEDLEVAPEIAFARLCSVETWPVWLSLVKRTTLNVPQQRLQLGSDITLWSELSRGREEIYEVDEFIEPYILNFVGAYSCRRRIEFRIERRNEESRIVVRICYPIYGGPLFESVDRLTLRPRLIAALEHSLETFKGLVEHDAVDVHERSLA